MRVCNSYSLDHRHLCAHRCFQCLCLCTQSTPPTAHMPCMVTSPGRVLSPSLVSAGTMGLFVQICLVSFVAYGHSLNKAGWPSPQPPKFREGLLCIASSDNPVESQYSMLRPLLISLHTYAVHICRVLHALVMSLLILYPLPLKLVVQVGPGVQRIRSLGHLKILKNLTRRLASRSRGADGIPDVICQSPSTMTRMHQSRDRFVIVFRNPMPDLPSTVDFVDVHRPSRETHLAAPGTRDSTFADTVGLAHSAWSSSVLAAGIHALVYRSLLVL